MAFVFGATAPGGGGSFSGGNITGATTVTAGITFAVTTADKLTCGGKIVPQTKTITIPLFAGVQTSAINILCIDETYQVIAIRVVDDGSEVGGTVVTIGKATGTTAPGAGTTMLSSSISLSGTANTVLLGTLTGTTSTLQLVAGDRIYWDPLGSSITGNVAITITLKRI